MHSLRLLLVPVMIAAAIAAGFGVLLLRTGRGDLEAVLFGGAVFFAQLVQWAVLAVWTQRRRSEARLLIEETRRLAESRGGEPASRRGYHPEMEALAGAVDDLYERLAAERQSLTEHRSAVEQIIGALGEGLMAVDASGRIVFANPRVTEMFGAEGLPAGRTVIEVVRKRAVVDAIDRALNGQATVTRIVAHGSVDERQIEVRAVPVKSSREVAAAAFFVDVSDVQRLQRIRSEFLEDFSHEIRTPLAGLRSAAETLEGGHLTREHEEALRQVMRRQLNRIERLVLDIAELNRIESGALVLEKSVVDLREILSDVADEMREREGLQSPRFTFRGDAAMTVADPVRLQQVFSNLLDNAAKYGDGAIEIETARQGRHATVRVLDNGEGISTGDLDRIFNRFYRVDRSRSQHVPGLGLGLAIAKHIVLLHGGDIRAFNRPEGGAGFEVRLPAA